MFFLFLLCAIVPVCVLAFLSINQVYERLEAETFRKLRYSSKSAGYMIYSHMLALEEYLQSVGAAPSLLRKENVGAEQVVPRPIAAQGFKSLASGCSGDHRILSGSPPDPALIPRDILEQSERAHALLFHLAGFRDNEPALIMLARCSDAEEDLAVVYGQIDLQLLGEKTMNVLPPDTDLHIFGPEGMAYFSLPLLSGPTRSQILRSLRKSSSGSLRWNEADDGMLGMYWSVFMKSRFHSDDWTVLTATSKAAAFAPMHEFGWTLGFVLLLTLLLVSLLSIWQIRNNLVPLARLKEATAEISRGQFAYRVDVSSNNEFGELADSFNQMAEELSARESQLEEAHVALIHSERLAAFGQLGAGIAHEVKNPLAGILAVAQLAMKQSDDSNPFYSKMALIERETVRCKKIIDNLLRFARQDRLPREQVSINTVLTDATRLIEHQLAIHDVRLKLELSEQAGEVLVSPNQIQQVIMNLAMNAQEAMAPHGGTVWISSHPGPARTVEVVVRDDGPGIPGDILPNIFNPFFTTKPSGKGTGLGLSVSYGIIRDHDGTITVESIPGQGTSFVLTFPQSVPNLSIQNEESCGQVCAAPSEVGNGFISSG